MKSNKIRNFANLTRAQLNDKELEFKKTLQVSDYFATDIPYSPELNKELVRDLFKSVAGIVPTHKKNIPQFPLSVPPALGAMPRLSEGGMPFMDSRFNQDVLHEDNHKIFIKTVDLAVRSINVRCLLHQLESTY
jgi:hypothetical protein